VQVSERGQGLEITHCCYFPGISRILLDLIHGLLIAVAGDVIVLSDTKIGAPASKEGTSHHF
jgi:hypothetical protein